MNVLPLEKQTTIIAALVDGCSIRTAERLTNVHRDTIMRLGVKVGENCRGLHHQLFRKLNVGVIELDEQWAFVGKKQKQVQPGDPPELGDIWLFIAFAATSKAIVSYVVGKRSAQNTLNLAADLRWRILNRPQITADGFSAYPSAIDRAFGLDVDFATIEKEYQAPPPEPAAHRYSPSTIRRIEKTVVRGTPDPALISTSYVERFNLTTRMQCRRFTRLTSGFSKKAENHAAACSLHIAHYNLCRVHETLRMTPAMALGVTDHIWTIGELIEQASAAPAGPTTPPPVPTTVRSGSKPYQLRVIRGGKLAAKR